MKNVTTKATAKVAAVATGLAMATSMLALAPIAHAQTTTTTTTSSSSCSVGTMDLTIGSTGVAVTCLQSALIANGYSIPAGATGYFGLQTRAAVSAWQAAVGVFPAAGYFGPISRAHWNLSAGGSSTTTTTTVAGCVAGAMFSSTTGQACGSTAVAGCGPGALFSSTTGQACGTTTTTSTGPLAGTDGSISDVTELGSYNGEDVSEGNNGVKVLGADVEASNDGDIALKSVKVSFDYNGSASDNLDDYFDSVDVWLGSTKIGSDDVADFNEDSNGVWSKTITVSNAIIRSDDVAQLYVSVDAVGNIDSGDLASSAWIVDVDNIRFIDGSGVTTTESGFDLGDMNVNIDIVSFSTSADTELKISTASDNPNAGIVMIDDVSDTSNVSLLKGKLKLDGTSDVLLDEFPVTFTAAGATLAETTGSVTLKIGSQTFTESVSSSDNTATITFENLDFDIDAEDTVDFEILADINDTNGNFGEGDTLLASVTASNRDMIDVENSAGDQLADSNEKSGTATGEAQEFRLSGIMLTLVSTNAVAPNSTTGANNDSGTFSIKFKVTAVGDTVYVSSLAEITTAATNDGYVTVLPDRAGTATAATGGSSVTLTNSTDTDLNATGLYTIEEGESHTFEVVTTLTNPSAGTSGQYRVKLGAVSWTTTSTDATPDNQYTSNLDTFRTSYVLID